MYKALDIRDDTEIVILDRKWSNAIKQLRDLDRQDILVCQGCRQPVRVRAGEFRRKHFAHKHLGNCDYEGESQVLHDARAILYDWLVDRFGDDVTIEKQIEGTNLFRPIDCWVRRGMDAFAYWIFDTTLKPEKREILQDYFDRSGIHIHWVFALPMKRTEQDHPERLVLSTTERQFIERSNYDALYLDGYLVGGTLHYLDADNKQLLTFRSLSLRHPPQIYQGTSILSVLDKVSISVENGEFVHEGEETKLQEYRERMKSLDGSHNRRWEQLAVQRNFSLANQSSHNHIASSAEIVQPTAPAEQLQGKEEGQTMSRNPWDPKPARCIYCGQITEDWWWHEGKTNTCKCRPCRDMGKS